jgi:hypothetical protein
MKSTDLELKIKCIDKKCLGIGIAEAKGVCKRIVRFDGEPITNLPSMPEVEAASKNENNNNIILKEYRCVAYIDPSAKWRMCNCPLASHLTVMDTKDRGKKRVGQQKQKKR